MRANNTTMIFREAGTSVHLAFASMRLGFVQAGDDGMRTVEAALHKELKALWQAMIRNQGHPFEDDHWVCDDGLPLDGDPKEDRFWMTLSLPHAC